MRGPSSRRIPPSLLLVFLPVLAGCEEAVRPALGGLQIGRRGVSFRMPVMENEELPFRYPARAWRDGAGGTAVVRIHITEAGAVDSVEVARSSGHAALDSAALADARRLRYRPARRGETPVDVWATLPVRYPHPAGR